MNTTVAEEAKIDPHSEEYAPRLGLPLLLGMNHLGKPMFGGLNGDAAYNRLDKRRAKNKVARKSRRINRSR